MLSLDRDEDAVGAVALKVCGDQCNGEVYEGLGPKGWLSAVLRRDCSLARRPRQGHDRVQVIDQPMVGAAQAAGPATSAGPSQQSLPAAAKLGYANEGQFLVLSLESLLDLRGRLPAGFAGQDNRDSQGCSFAPEGSEPKVLSKTPREQYEQHEHEHEHQEHEQHAHEQQHELSPSVMAFAERFRPNLLVRALEPYAEDDWAELTIGGGGGGGEAVKLVRFKPCNRCGVVNVEPRTARRHREPYLTLAQYRRSQGKVLFGSLFSTADPPPAHQSDNMHGGQVRGTGQPNRIARAVIEVGATISTTHYVPAGRVL